MLSDAQCICGTLITEKELNEAYLRGIADFKRAALEENEEHEHGMNPQQLRYFLDRAEEKLTKDV